MAEYQNKPLTTNIFKNNKKEKDTHPDFKGQQLEVPGAGTFDVALWERKDRNGNTFFGLKLSEPFVPNQQQQGTPAPQAAPTQQQGVEDDLPF